MSRIYTDYVNKTAITIPDKFIDVKTGEAFNVPQNVADQIEYHAKNNTLIHLVLSAINQYLQPKPANASNAQILFELTEIKRMMQMGYVPINNSFMNGSGRKQNLPSEDLDIKEVEDVLDAFGG